MEKSRKAITVTVFVGFFFSAASCAVGEAIPSEEITYVSISWAESPATIEELVELADVIVEARISGVANVGNMENTAVGPMPYVDFSAEINKVLAGEADYEKITIRQGGDIEGKMVFHDDPLMELGDEYVLFLTEYAPGEYRINGGSSGRMTVTNEGEIVVLPSTSLLPNEYVSNVAELELKLATIIEK